MTIHPLDQIITTFKIADPSNELPLTARMLCQNLLITGGVGSGKTTSGINPLLRDVIRFRAKEPALKTGLFVFDSKTDGTTERVRAWAEECGRAEDVQILGPGGTYGYNPFGTVVGSTDVEILASKLESLSASQGHYGDDNAYWTTTTRSLLAAALGVHLMAFGNMELNSTLQWLSGLLLTTMSQAKEAWEKVHAVRSALDTLSLDLDGFAYRSMDGYCKMLGSWERIDPKTKGILVTCIQHILGPLLSPRIQQIFPSEYRPAVRVADIVDEGKILIFRLNAASDPELSSNIGRMLKAELYSAIQQRRFKTDDDARLVGLFLDEYPLVATGNQPYFGDVQNLQTMREKRAFVIAATQGFVSLQNAIGARAWEGLRINLTNQIYFRSNEPEVESLARVILGKHPRSQSLDYSMEGEDSRDGTLVTESRQERTVRVKADDWIIQAGALARLEDHEAYYSLAGGMRSESPAFFLPDFSAPKLDPLPQTDTKMDEAFARVYDLVNPKPIESKPAEEEQETDTTGMLNELFPIKANEEAEDTNEEANQEPSAEEEEESQATPSINTFIAYIQFAREYEEEEEESSLDSLPMVFESLPLWINLRHFSWLKITLNDPSLCDDEPSEISAPAEEMSLSDFLQKYSLDGFLVNHSEECLRVRLMINKTIDATMEYYKETSRILRDFRGHHGSRRFLKQLTSATKHYYAALGLPVENSIFEKPKKDVADILIEPSEFLSFDWIQPHRKVLPRSAFNTLTRKFLSSMNDLYQSSEWFRGVCTLPKIDSMWFPNGLPILVLSRDHLDRDFAYMVALFHISFFTTFTAHLPSQTPANWY